MKKNIFWNIMFCKVRSLLTDIANRVIFLCENKHTVNRIVRKIGCLNGRF